MDSVYPQLELIESCGYILMHTVHRQNIYNTSQVY